MFGIPSKFFAWVMALALTLCLAQPGARASAAPAARSDIVDCTDGPGWVQLSDGQRLALRPDCQDHQPLPVAMREQPGALAPQAIGGPDVFGYMYDDGAALNWIDASGGTNTGLSNAGNAVAGPIAIGFPFKYYENTRDELWISRQGGIGFNAGLQSYVNDIPSTDTPNDLIAIDWWSWSLEADSQITYLSGGSAPNRYLVIQWSHLKGAGGDFTFQTVLWESGDIWLQYLAMNYAGAYPCSRIGFEDSLGIDGLGYMPLSCPNIPSGRAIRILRPAPAARVGVYPLSQGQHQAPGDSAVFTLPLRNTGDLGDDTFNLVIASSPGWPVTLYAADGSTALTDTDANGQVDTGVLAPLGQTDVVVSVTAPPSAPVGAANTVAVTILSGQDPTRGQIVRLQTAVPAPFAHAVNDAVRYPDAVSLYLATPAIQTRRVFGAPLANGSNGALIALNSGFGLAYGKGRQANTQLWAHELYFTFLDPLGRVPPSGVQLADLSSYLAATYATDGSYALAQAPDGRIGLLWVRQLAGSSGSQGLYNYNVWFAVLTPQGQIEQGPVNLTQDASWAPYDAQGAPRFDQPQLAATGDNRFVLAWERTVYGQPAGACTAYCSAEDIVLAIRSSTGAEILTPRAVTQDTVGWDESFNDPIVTALPGNQFLLAYRQTLISDILYTIYNSAGGVTKPTANLSGDGTGNYDYGPGDAEVLSDGRVVVAWLSGGQPRLATLNQSYNRIGGPLQLSIAAAPNGAVGLSIASAGSGRAVVTWSDYTKDDNLYYALVDGAGTVLTAPMIFQSGGYSGRMYTHLNGNGSAAFAGSIPAGGDGVVRTSHPIVGGTPGERVRLAVEFDNLGASPLTDAVLTATLGPGLTFVSDTSGRARVASGQTVTWDLGDLALAGGIPFVLTLEMDDSVSLGTQSPVALALTWSGSDLEPANNAALVQVMAAQMMNLPLARR